MEPIDVSAVRVLSEGAHVVIATMKMHPLTTLQGAGALFGTLFIVKRYAKLFDFWREGGYKIRIGDDDDAEVYEAFHYDGSELHRWPEED